MEGPPTHRSVASLRISYRSILRLPYWAGWSSHSRNNGDKNYSCESVDKTSGDLTDKHQRLEYRTIRGDDSTRFRCRNG